MKIIFKCRVGSHLYGTNRADSDEDFAGVFLPSIEQLCSIKGFDHEVSESVKLSKTVSNQVGDVDSKLFSIQKFLKLVYQGQPGQLEMLFAPKEAIIIKNWPLWDILVASRTKLLSQKSILPFLNFALSQVRKATLKGEHLKEIEAILRWGESLSTLELNADLYKNYESFDLQNEGCGTAIFSSSSEKVYLPYGPSNTGVTQLSIGGRHFGSYVKTKAFLSKLKQIRDKYGERSKKAASLGFDYKSLGHAARLVDEAEELVFSKKITLPRPNSLELLKIFNAEVNAEELLSQLSNRINQLQQDVIKSSLPKDPDWKEAEELCQHLMSFQFQE
jgi:hypothetical protein